MTLINKSKMREIEDLVEQLESVVSSIDDSCIDEQQMDSQEACGIAEVTPIFSMGRWFLIEVRRRCLKETDSLEAARDLFKKVCVFPKPRSKDATLARNMDFVEAAQGARSMFLYAYHALGWACYQGTFAPHWKKMTEYVLGYHLTSDDDWHLAEFGASE